MKKKYDSNRIYDAKYIKSYGVTLGLKKSRDRIIYDYIRTNAIVNKSEFFKHCAEFYIINGHDYFISKE